MKVKTIVLVQAENGWLVDCNYKTDGGNDAQKKYVVERIDDIPAKIEEFFSSFEKKGQKKS